MSKGFSKKEKLMIRKALLDQGKILFGSYGLKKTSIADLTRAVGIAQGSFYKFYDSKEELYFEILENEESNLREKLFMELEPFEDHPREYLKNLLLRSLDMVDDYPLMTQLYLENTMETLVRKLPDDRLIKHFDKDHASFLPFIHKWQAQGILREEKPETITSLVRAVLLLSLHKKEIGEEVYSSTMELLVELLAEGLVLEEK
ncbi:transcriptional regulator, tetr family [hydrocarbon metagenome]|uniref:Transcriptional regulator, tetr family n=1 Tax=hydrocarbon metagenome TaxID=938273 RepID=A0A0W8E2B3_9ZZZZ